MIEKLGFYWFLFFKTIAGFLKNQNIILVLFKNCFYYLNLTFYVFFVLNRTKKIKEIKDILCIFLLFIFQNKK